MSIGKTITVARLNVEPLLSDADIESLRIAANSFGVSIEWAVRNHYEHARKTGELRTMPAAMMRSEFTAHLFKCREGRFFEMGKNFRDYMHYCPGCGAPIAD